MTYDYDCCTFLSNSDYFLIMLAHVVKRLIWHPPVALQSHFCPNTQSNENNNLADHSPSSLLFHDPKVCFCQEKWSLLLVGAFVLIFVKQDRCLRMCGELLVGPIGSFAGSGRGSEGSCSSRPLPGTC